MPTAKKNSVPTVLSHLPTGHVESTAINDNAGHACEMNWAAKGRHDEALSVLVRGMPNDSISILGKSEKSAYSSRPAPSEACLSVHVGLKRLCEHQQRQVARKHMATC